MNGEVAGNEQLPITVAPSRKFTVPAGLPAPGLTTLTVAVKVTLCPKTEGFTDEARAVLVLALEITKVTVVELVTVPLVAVTVAVSVSATGELHESTVVWVVPRVKVVGLKVQARPPV